MCPSTRRRTVYVDETLVTILGYEMSYLEAAGTILNLLSVWLIVKRHVMTWPIGIAGSVMFAILFIDIRLYSDLILQMYIVVTGFYGWQIWRGGTLRPVADTAITWLSWRAIGLVVAIGLGATLAMGTLMARADRVLPVIFDAPAQYPYLDAFQTVLSFIAQIAMAHRKIDSWILWIMVDIASIGLYIATDLLFIALLYCLFLVLAVRGLFEWLGVRAQTTAVASGIRRVESGAAP